MKYRAYRIEKEKVHNKRLEVIANHSGYPSPALKIKVLDNGKRTSWFDGEEYDYIKRMYRGKRSKYLKKYYSKSFRNGKNSDTIYKGNTYRKVSGDFWWDLT